MKKKKKKLLIELLNREMFLFYITGFIFASGYVYACACTIQQSLFVCIQTCLDANRLECIYLVYVRMLSVWNIYEHTYIYIYTHTHTHTYMKMDVICSYMHITYECVFKIGIYISHIFVLQTKKMALFLS